MRRLLSVLTLAAVAACAAHDGPTPPPQLGLALAIAAGDSQVAPVTDTLPQPIDVVATLTASGDVMLRVAGRGAVLASTAGSPAAHTTVSFHVLDAGCGQPYSADLVTDSTGHALNRWILGTHAGDCRMSTGYVDQQTGQIVIVDTATATAQPGPVAYVDRAGASVLVPSGTAARDSVPVGAAIAYPFVYSDYYHNAGALTMPDGGPNGRLSAVYDSTVVRLDSIVAPGRAARYGYDIAVGWVYFTGIARGQSSGLQTPRVFVTLNAADSTQTGAYLGALTVY